MSPQEGGQHLGSEDCEVSAQGQSGPQAGGGDHEQAAPPQAPHAVGRVRVRPSDGTRHGVVSGWLPLLGFSGSLALQNSTHYL